MKSKVRRSAGRLPAHPQVLEAVLAHHLDPRLQQRRRLVERDVLAREDELGRAGEPARPRAGLVEALAGLGEGVAKRLWVDRHPVAHTSPPCRPLASPSRRKE